MCVPTADGLCTSHQMTFLHEFSPRASLLVYKSLKIKVFIQQCDSVKLSFKPSSLVKKMGKSIDNVKGVMKG